MDNKAKDLFGGLLLCLFLRGGEDSGTERKKAKAYSYEEGMGTLGEVDESDGCSY